MKRKVLSTLLAVCLFVGVAIPAVFAASADSQSSVSGTDDEITSLKFKKSSYELKLDGEPLDLKNEVVAYCGTKKIVDNPSLEFSITNPDAAFFLTDSGVISAGDEKGTGTVTVTVNDGKIKASVKVVAKPRQAYATGFEFEKSSYQVPVKSGADDFIMQIVPVPRSAKFTQSQIEAISLYIDGFIDLKDGKGNVAAGSISSKTNKNGYLEMKFAASDLSSFTNVSKQGINNDNRFEFQVKFPKASNGDETNMAKRITISTVEAVEAKLITSTSSSVTVQVGETKDISSMFRVGPSSTNTTKEITYSTDYINANASYDDYAKVSLEGKITGVAIGENKVVATLENGKTTSINVKVVAANSTTSTSTESKLSETGAELKIGDSKTLSVQNTGDAEVTWKVEDNSIVNIDVTTKTTATISAKAVGTTKITAKINDVEIGTCTITVKEANTAKPPVTPNIPITSNPQTGDSLFANLF